ncbi:hypothetical protein SPRG_17066 [Saprolegnia parasitica CBS 223.65]|uniref:Uncharacterized protein n=1 Tax=Saprolegnia parasitica (strain CBS 223.65) TaxID=695850 RepID=A0A067BSN9_SAPPC|nr:hypothetical protein SPRG_17066 [Saprolegnia parasitica CBS 223.65]KDO17296.1 hypothetical protein SPRG_17066 [Saprolegnia parasitica CBS 223.65]|eukprot:XP_012211995.1 hypothetical protein SPRG_17066 [Saprolegnia parasitica CBS 223.65]
MLSPGNSLGIYPEQITPFYNDISSVVYGSVISVLRGQAVVKLAPDGAVLHPRTFSAPAADSVLLVVPAAEAVFGIGRLLRRCVFGALESRWFHAHPTSGTLATRIVGTLLTLAAMVWRPLSWRSPHRRCRGAATSSRSCLRRAQRQGRARTQSTYSSRRRQKTRYRRRHSTSLWDALWALLGYIIAFGSSTIQSFAGHALVFIGHLRQQRIFSDAHRSVVVKWFNAQFA